MTAHTYELAALVAAARLAAEGGRGDMDADAMKQLCRVIASYDSAAAALDGPAFPA